MNQLKVFKNSEFGQVRSVIANKQPWFITKDVCKCLEIKNNRDALSRIDDDEKRVVLTDTLGGKQELLAVNESGLYSLILGSRKKEAKKFKRWVTHEVLPSIRRHGMYATDELLSNPDFAIQVFQQLKAEREEKVKLQSKIQEDKPYTNFGKAISTTDDGILIGEYAKLLKNDNIEIGQNRLFSWFRNNGYLIKDGRRKNNPIQKYLEQGLFRVWETVVHTPKGDKTRTTTLITGKGQLYFINKLREVA